MTRGRSELGTLPGEVGALLHDHIASFEQLLVLLLLHKSYPKSLSTSAIADQLGITSGLPEALMALHAAELIKTETENSELIHVYTPADANLAKTVSVLQQSYQSHPTTIMQLMSENAIARVRRAAHRAFSDAFLIRKGKDRG